MYQQAQKTCSRCSATFEGFGDKPEPCPNCRESERLAQLTAYRARVSPGLKTIVGQRMARLGVPKRTRRAVPDEVPKEIKRRLPVQAVEAFIAGKAPAFGFGLVGGQGVGKSCALAALIRKGLERLAEERLAGLQERPWDRHDDELPDWAQVGTFLWSGWPEEAEGLKEALAYPNGNRHVAERVRALMVVPLLILDDLGRERIRNADDFALAQLDRIIDHRCSEELPTLWTSNSTLPEMAPVYGPPLLSRLQALAPVIELPDLPDLRLVLPETIAASGAPQ